MSDSRVAVTPLPTAPPFIEYWWPDLKGRRNALSLWPEDFAPLLGMDLARYRSYESGGRRLGPSLVGELIAMEAFVADETSQVPIAAGVA